MKKNNNKGFTLMEMLIVVAIIAILIAIAIPTFSKTLERARESTDGANLRTAYATAMSEMLVTNDEAFAVSAEMTQADGDTWVNEEIAKTVLGDANNEDVTSVTISDITGFEKGDKIKITVDTEGNVDWEVEDGGSSEGGSSEGGGGEG